MGCRKEKGGCTQRDDHRRFRRGKIHFRREFPYQLLEQDYTVVVVEFGKVQPALQTLSQESLHVDYDGKTPLGINPFDLQGRRPDNTDLETIIGNRAALLETHVHRKGTGERR